MSVIARTLTALAGSNYVSNATLNGVRVLGVKRSGTQFTEVNTTPGNLEFRHVGPKIIFDSAVPLNAGERVVVLFET